MKHIHIKAFHSFDDMPSTKKATKANTILKARLNAFTSCIFVIGSGRIAINVFDNLSENLTYSSRKEALRDSVT